MDFSAPETAPILLWTLMRGAALAVLATEAIFLWTRRSEPQPSAAQAAARLFWAATPAILLVGWGIFFAYCLIKYRARPGHAATYLPPKAQFTKVIEVAVIVVEVLLLFGFSTPVWFRYKNHPPPEKDALIVKLVAEQFAWNFQYSGKDGKFGKTSEANISGDNPVGMDADDADGKDDIVTVNQ